MKRGFLRRLKYGGLALVGAHKVSRLINRDRFLVLMYHGITAKPLPIPCWTQVDASNFRKQMDYLRDNYDVWHLADMIEHMENGKTLPNHCAAITFDDGFRNFADTAYPMLRERALPATVFLATGGIDNGTHIWTDQLFENVTQTKHTELDLASKSLGKYQLTTTTERSDAVLRIGHRLKSMPNDQRECVMHEIAQQLDIAGAPIDTFDLMSWDEVKRLAKDDLVRFCGHTVNHVILSRCDAATQEAEIVNSQQRVMEHTEVRADGFAYPNGRAEDFDANTIAILKRASVKYAVSTVEGLNSQDAADVFALRRKGIGNDMTLARFKVAIASR